MVRERIRSYELMTGRLSSHTDSGGASVIAGYDYNYTARGNISQIVESGQVSQTRNYSYDALERLTEVDVPDAPSRDESYQLDEEGNRLSSHLSQTHVTDRANRLLSDDDYTYVYDLNGNLIGKRAKRAGLPDWDYGYDDLDLLISVSKDGEVVERYRYDALGRRSLIETSDGAGGFTATGLINDGSDRVIDLTDNNLTGAISLRFTHSDRVDEPIIMERFDGNGVRTQSLVFHADHIGSIRYITNEAGQVVHSYEYDSYGYPIQKSEAFEQPFLYTGREWSELARLYYYRARTYDPRTARFLQEDPLGFAAGDHNFYRYVKNNPLTYSDPTGLSQTAERSAVAGAGGAVGVGGRISIEALKQGGRRLWQELLRQDLAPAARLGGQVACQYFSIAAVIDGGTGEMCGAGTEDNTEDMDVVITASPGGDPGDCNDDEYEKLRANKRQACELSRSCLTGKKNKRTITDRSTILEHISNGEACLAARMRVMDICFKGGDPRHQKEAQRVRNDINTCRGAL